MAVKVIEKRPVRRVYVAQILCPSRHCVMASAGEYDSDDAAVMLGIALERQNEQMVAAGVIKDVCGLCGSRDLRVEIGRSSWSSMDEARPHLKAVEAAQLATREFLDSLKARQN